MYMHTSQHKFEDFTSFCWLLHHTRALFTVAGVFWHSKELGITQESDQLPDRTDMVHRVMQSAIPQDEQSQVRYAYELIICLVLGIVCNFDIKCPNYIINQSLEVIKSVN